MISSLNSVESPNTFILNSNQKRNTIDCSMFKPEENESNSSYLVTKETVMNGQTKTVDFLQDSLSQTNNETMPVKEHGKFRKESLQVKIFKNPTFETCSPSLRKDLEDYNSSKNEKQMDNENKVLSPLIIIRENVEEEEKKN